MSQMRKEIIFAILTGGFLGLIIAFGIWRINSSLTKKPGSNHIEASPLPTAENNFSITLAKIENNDVITSIPLTVNGLTKPFSQVAISGESKDYLTAANSDGEFSENISLDAGINQVLINSFDQNGSYSEIISTLVYSSEFAKYLNATSSGSLTSNSIRDKVQQKVDEALNKPKAYIGSITDIVESTIQVKSDQGEILQLSTDSQTTYLKTLTAKSTDIKFSDLAIGDYIVGMGIKNGNKVLEAKRILVVNAPEKINRNILFGRITDSTAKALTFETLKDKKSYQIAFDKNTDFLVKKGDKISTIKIANVNDGEDMAFIFNTVNNDGSYLARTIIVIRDIVASPSPTSTPKPTPKE